MGKIPDIPAKERDFLKMKRPHVVLLGAGASRAAFPEGDKKGLKLPLMCDFVEVVGLSDELEKYGVPHAGRNFEEVVSDLYYQSQYQECLARVEEKIHDYFTQMVIPEPPTIYDHLILSLQPKDVVATFNWDPFLFQACARSAYIAKPPRIMFLHGNVTIGFCEKDRTKGPVIGKCFKCGNVNAPSKLLYPIKQKNYTSSPFIEAEWQGLQSALSHAYVFTIFGYGAPTSDVEAVKLLKQGWGRRERRELEQVEVIDLKHEDELRETWDSFILEHHYDIESSFYSSWIARHTRRSCDAVWRQTMELEFLTDNPIPQQLSFSEQVAWFGKLMSAEK
jgi:hypothetical protein